MKYLLVFLLAANVLVGQTRTVLAEIEIEFTVREFGFSKVTGWLYSDGMQAEARFQEDILLTFEGCVAANSFSTGVAARDRNVVNQEGVFACGKILNYLFFSR